MTSTPPTALVDRFDKRLVHTVIERQAGQCPRAVAIEEAERSVTYGRLETDANRLAHGLWNAGVRCGDVVGVALDPGICHVTSLLAVLKAGAVYLPLDLGFPAPRLRRMLEVGSPRALITDPPGQARLTDLWASQVAPYPNVLVWNAAGDLPEASGPAPTTPPDLCLDPDAGCYLFFTSGSTGEPKAILGRHKSLGHFVHWQAGELGLDRSTRVSQLVPLTFDASLRDLLTPLSVGGTVCVPARDDRAHMGRLKTWLVDQKISLVHTVPSVFRRLTATLLDAAQDATVQHGPDLLPHLRHVLLAGEALYRRDVAAWRRALGPSAAEVINLYGATENTLIKMFHRVPTEIDHQVPEPAGPDQVIPIGRAISNTVAFICVDGRLARAGEVGEIYIKTPFLSHGYYGDEQATARIFVPNPLADAGAQADDDRVHRTGDLGRYLPADGDSRPLIEWVGRADDLVKINGARVEPEEVKRITLRHPRVADAAVLGLGDGHGGRRLVCYFVEAPDFASAGDRPSTESTSESLRRWQTRHLPAYMVPSFRVPLDRLPVNRHGKLDRQALPSPESVLDEREFTAPRDALEQTVHDIWCRVLNLPRIDIHRSFFDLGGHSLAAARILPRLHQSLGVELSPAQLFLRPTVAGQAQCLRQAQNLDSGGESSQGPNREAKPKPRMELVPAPPADTYPLSHAQRRIWVLRQLDDHGAAYNMPGSYLVTGELQTDATRQALQLLLDRHEVLRTAVVEVDGEPRQSPVSSCTLHWRTDDLRGHSDPLHAARRLAQAEADYAFDLSSPPLMRAALLRLPDEGGQTRHVLLLNLHHIACDGWSLGLLLTEWRDAYWAIVERRADSLPRPAALQYKDFALWQHRRLESGALDRQREYWHRQLAGPLPRLDLMTDRPRGATQTFGGHTLGQAWDAELSSRLIDFCAERQASPFMGLLALLQILLHRLTHQRDLVVGTAVASRPHPDLEEQIGCYLNLLALRAQVDPSVGFQTRLADAARVTAEALQHQHYPFDLLVDELRVPRDLSRSPVFDVMLVVHNQPPLETLNHRGRGDGLQIEDFMPRDGVSRYDLTVHCRLETGADEASESPRLRVDFEYNTDLYSRERMEAMMGSFRRLADAALRDPLRPLAHLPLISSAEREQLDAWGSSPQPVAPATPIEDVFERLERQTVERAAKAAIIGTSGSLSFDDVGRWSRRVTAGLNAFGRPERVAVMLDRGPRLPAVLLGIAQAGSAYVPVDPGFPRGRMLHMLDHSECGLLITEPRMATELRSEGLPVGLKITTLDELTSAVDEPETPAGETPDSASAIHPQAPAYVIYTSGSTGVPKGVTVRRGNASAYAHGLSRLLNIRADDRWLALTTVSFDIAFTELVVAPALGIPVVLANAEEALDPARLATLIQERGVTVLQTTPSRLELLLEEAGADFLTGLRALLIGGEAFPERLRQRLRPFPDLNVANVYGPTETTVWSAFCPLTEDGEIHLGRAAEGETLSVLSPAGEPMPPGYPGELCIGGAGVAAGYHRQPTLTAERFVPDPSGGGGRLYRTGDLAMWTPEGRLHFLGRLDFQLKFRGYRIEPGEIEAALCRQPGIARAVVSVMNLPVKTGAGEPALCAHCVVDPSRTQPKAEDLRRALGESLPAYMIPSHFVFLDHLPTTANNKVDRKALPAPRHAEAAAERSVGPRNPVERRIAALWCEVLGLSSPAVDQRFFDSGGDSVRAIRLLRLLNEAWPGRFKASDLFTAVTIADQARLAEAASSSTSTPAKITTPATAEIVEIEI